MIVYSLTDTGANIYDCNYAGDSIVRLHHLSYADFVQLQGTGPKGKLTLLRSDNYDIIEPPVQKTILDLNGVLDGREDGNITGFGTVDVYINGNLDASDVTDYCKELPVGTSYEIRNIQALEGRCYNGVYSGSLYGTIGNERVNVVLSFSTLVYLNLDGYLDGAANDGLGQYGTADVYINGELVASAWNDYWEAWPVGTTYEIKNIRANEGHRYDGVYSGSLAGTLGAERVNVVLRFTTLHTYSFDADGDYGTMAPIQIAIGDSIAFPACTFARDGYSFQGWRAYRANDGKYACSVGWRTEEEMTADGLFPTIYPDQLSFMFDRTWTDGITGSANIILYALWNPNTYTIKYDGNGGTGVPVNQTKTHGEVITLSTTIPTRESYYFLGWAENADATEATYQPDGIFDQDTDVTLYAVWKLREPDLILPSALTTIESEAFAGGAFTYAHITDGVTRIERRAFAGCPNLKDVDIPASATSIDPTAFADTSGLTIHSTDGSYAEFYANKYGFGFVTIQ